MNGQEQEGTEICPKSVGYSPRSLIYLFLSFVVIVMSSFKKRRRRKRREGEKEKRKRNYLRVDDWQRM